MIVDLVDLCGPYILRDIYEEGILLHHHHLSTSAPLRAVC